jgi:hypothetical protein
LFERSRLHLGYEADRPQQSTGFIILKTAILDIVKLTFLIGVVQ